MTDRPKKRRKRFHRDLEGFDIKVNPFGELESSFDVDKINAFLNEKVEDKKLRDQSDTPADDEEE